MINSMTPTQATHASHARAFSNGLHPEISLTTATDIAISFAEGQALTADNPPATATEALAQCVRGVAEALAQWTDGNDYDRQMLTADHLEALITAITGGDL